MIKIKVSKYHIRGIWLIIAVMILATSLFDFINSTDELLKREIGFRHLLLMSFISLPVGPALLFIVDKLIAIRSSGLSEIFGVWISCIIGGYFQWFYLVPKIVGYVRRRNQPGRLD